MEHALLELQLSALMALTALLIIAMNILTLAESLFHMIQDAMINYIAMARKPAIKTKDVNQAYLLVMIMLPALIIYAMKIQTAALI